MADVLDLTGTTLPPDLDKLEWDAGDPAGDETAYDGLAVMSTPFHEELFPENDEVEEIDLEDGSIRGLLSATAGTNFPHLADHLRKWGLQVVEVKGWRNRSANGSFKPQGVVVHHTASNKDSGNAPSLGIVKNGRPGIPGPLAQFVLGRNGKVYLVSGNRANHAGLGGPHGVIPKDSANGYMWGIEAENNGIGEKWGEAQLQAYYRLTAALQVLIDNKTANYVIGHKEWTSRKSDPAGIKMNDFRLQVERAMKSAVIRRRRPRLKNLKPGLRNADVRFLQQKLVIQGVLFPAAKVSGFYGKDTEKAVARFQRKQGWKGTGKVGPLTYLKLFGFKS